MVEAISVDKAIIEVAQENIVDVKAEVDGEQNIPGNQIAQKRLEKRKKKMSRQEYYAIPEGCCPYILPQKQRACKKSAFTRPDGTKSKYCMVHAYIDSPDIEYAACPYEPKNTMPKFLIEQHILVCPKAKELKSLESQPFYKKGINFFNQPLAQGQNEGKSEPKTEPKTDQNSKDQNQNDQNLNEQVKKSNHEADLSQLSDLQCLEKIEQGYEKLKQRFRSDEEVKELFTVDDQLDMVDELNEKEGYASKMLTEAIKHGN